MSALDARMRLIADQALADFTAAAMVTQERLTAMEQEVAELRTKLEQLEGAASTPTAKRATRAKTAETTE